MGHMHIWIVCMCVCMCVCMHVEHTPNIAPWSLHKTGQNLLTTEGALRYHPALAHQEGQHQIGPVTQSQLLYCHHMPAQEINVIL